MSFVHIKCHSEESAQRSKRKSYFIEMHFLKYRYDGKLVEKITIYSYLNGLSLRRRKQI